MTIITAEHLTFSYPMVVETVLYDISFTLESGEFVIVAGADGSGKTTLCYALSGLIPHFFKGDMAGTVTFDGVATCQILLKDLISRVGIVFQNPMNQLSHTTATVYEEVACTMENLGIPRQEMHERVTEILETMNLTSLKEKHPKTLSGGQAQRAAIASVLVLQPEILILDEPLAQLDPHSSQTILATLKSVSLAGTTVIIAAQDLRGSIEHADRIVVLAEGRVVCNTSPQPALSWLLTHNPGILIPPCIRVAGKAIEKGLWEGDGIPVTFDEAAEGFLRKWPQQSQ